MKKTAEEILKQMKDEMPYSLPQYCEPYILEAIQLGISQSLPPVSEEEIKLLKFIQRHLRIQKRNDTEQGFDKGFNRRTLELERNEIIEAASNLEKMILSRLPREQPVGKADKLEAEQPQEEAERREEKTIGQALKDSRICEANPDDKTL